MSTKKNTLESFMIVSTEQNVRLSCIRSQCTVPQLTYDNNKISKPYKHQSIYIMLEEFTITK